MDQKARLREKAPNAYLGQTTQLDLWTSSSIGSRFESLWRLPSDSELTSGAVLAASRTALRPGFGCAHECTLTMG